MSDHTRGRSWRADRPADVPGTGTAPGAADQPTGRLTYPGRALPRGAADQPTGRLTCPGRALPRGTVDPPDRPGEVAKGKYEKWPIAGRAWNAR